MHQAIFPLLLISFFYTCFFFFCSGPRDEMDNCGLFQIVFLTQAGRSMRTTEKAKILLGAAFYSQFVFICPPLPSAAFGSESALVLLAVTVCQGANRFLLTGASGGQVWVFHYFLYQVGIIWERVCPCLCVLMQNRAWIHGVCVCLKARNMFSYWLVCIREDEYICVYEVLQSRGWSWFPLCCLLSHFV